MRVGIYARVSTGDQDEGNQLLQLREYCARRGWTIIREYCDAGFSGAREDRPALLEMLFDARKRKFDVVLVWTFDRFARSVRQLVVALEEFDALGIQFVAFQQNIDTTQPGGRLLFQIIAAFAEFERAMIRERTRAGLARARHNGKRLGRPTMTLDVDRIAAAYARLGSYKAVAREMGIGEGTVRRALLSRAKNVSKVSAATD